MLRTFPLPFLLAAAVAAQASDGITLPGFVEEVPYVTTPDIVTAAMLDIARVQATDHLIDLGSGDGRIVIAAARRGATGLGVEIDPRLVAESRENAKRAGVTARARFLEQDLFATDLAPATVITMYLLPEVNLRLRPALLALRPGTRVVSHDWDLGDWPPDRTVVIDVPEKSIGREKRSRVHLWVVPAPVQGLWCGADAGSSRHALRLRQTYQALAGELRADGVRKTVAGRVDGTVVTLEPTGEAGRWQARWSDGALQATSAEGSLATGLGTAWKRATGGKCPEA